MNEIEQHIAEDVLIDYADNAVAVPNRAAIEQHLAACAACWTKLDDYRTLAVAMGLDEVWWLEDELRQGERQRVLDDVVARRANEDAEAARMLERLLESQYQFTHANIARKPRFRTGGVVRALCAAAREQFAREPRFALVLAEAAAVIAEALPDDSYPAGAVNELRGTAWKEYSIASRYLSQFSAGHDALSRAERAYRRLPDAEPHLADVDLCRAILHWEQQQYDEALRYTRSAAKCFSDRRDTHRHFTAREIEATILHRMGDVPAACETYRAAFDLADSLGDAEMKARSARNLGIACRDGGDLGEASRYFLVALQLYEGLEHPAMVVQTRWSIARLTLTAGNAQDAVPRLIRAVAELEQLGMHADAARAQLDLAEAWLMLGRFDRVQEVCKTVFGFFRNAQMLGGAVTAAAFLQEATARRRLTREHIEHVRQYLDDLRRQPDLLFAPPPLD